jgi:glyoxylase-like metal-dependent hydrolase (beta-lactamase superfamily II)
MRKTRAARAAIAGLLWAAAPLAAAQAPQAAPPSAQAAPSPAPAAPAPAAPAAPDPAQVRAVALLQQALEAHGGEAAAGALTLRLRYRADAVNPGQSLAVEGPFERYPMTVDFAIHQPKGLVRVDHASAIAGDFTFETRMVWNATEGYALDAATQTYTPLPGEPPHPERFLPHRRLQRLLRKPETLRAEGPDAASGLERVRYALPGNRSAVVLLAPDTHRVAAVQLPGMLPGTRTELSYAGYATRAGVLVPATVTETTTSELHGALTTVHRLDAKAPATPHDAPLPPPAGAKADAFAARPATSVQELAPGAYLVRNVTDSKGQWSYNVFFAVFADHVLVGEAPYAPDVSKQVLARIQEVAPGKPVRYLVASHHHDDHVGGLPTYVERGVTVVAPQGTRGLFTRMTRGAPKAAVVEEVAGRRVFRDDSNEVHVLDLGPSPHARHMLAVYLPRQGVLYQADQVNAGEYPANATTRHFARWLKRQGLQVRVLAGLHGEVLEGEAIGRTLEAALAGEKAARKAATASGRGG